MAAEAQDRTYVEFSSDGALMIELDRHGNLLRCQLEPEVNASWSAELLGERILRLYTLALMRARCDELARMNERGADMPPSELYPSAAQVADYRARYVNF